MANTIDKSFNETESAFKSDMRLSYKILSETNTIKYSVFFLLIMVRFAANKSGSIQFIIEQFVCLRITYL